jgi:hypothetical protein
MPESVTYVPGMICNLCARKHKDPGRFMTFRKDVIFVVVDESARNLAVVDAP